MNAPTAWELFRHGADIGVRGYGATLPETFEAVAVALTAVITDPAIVRSAGVSVDINCAAPDAELLLYEWLNRIVYEMAVRKVLFARAQVTIRRLDNDSMTLQATLTGEPVDRDRHAPAAEVKGATFTELRVAQLEPHRWCAQCVVDV